MKKEIKIKKFTLICMCIIILINGITIGIWIKPESYWKSYYFEVVGQFYRLERNYKIHLSVDSIHNKWLNQKLDTLIIHAKKHRAIDSVQWIQGEYIDITPANGDFGKDYFQAWRDTTLKIK